MNIITLINYLKQYSEDTEIKIIVNDKEEDIRCLIHNKDKNIIYISDCAYEC